MFLTINHVDELKTALSHKEEIAFNDRDGVTVCSYIYSAPTTFDSPASLEARGIVFGVDGSVISRPLHKFFNINEREETQAHLIPWDRVTRVMNKRDGSMIHTVKVDGNVTPFNSDAKFALKTKKSFTSDVANEMNKWLRNHSQVNDYVQFCNDCVDRNFTAIFEYTAPTSRIVLLYKEPSLKLLHIRDNLTGRYLTKVELIELSEKFRIPVVEDDNEAFTMLKKDPNQLFELAQSLEQLEGWVIQFDNGNMVKLKTKWYVNLHHSMTFLRERDVATLVLDEMLDDLKANLVSEGVDITPILKIEAEVVRQLNEIRDAITMKYEEVKHLDRKDIATNQRHRQFEHFTKLMQMYDGKEIDFLDYFKKNFLKSRFGLRQIVLSNDEELE